MTTTQINFWRLQEEHRHNLASENLTVKDLQIKSFNAKETKRHNLVNEKLDNVRNKISSYLAKETKRHNLVSEKISSYNAKETKRHNQANEMIDTSKLEETKRHNLVSEGETQRHNVATESLTATQIDEAIRHNTTSEQETQRHNEASEAETHRHNSESETIQAIQAESVALLNNSKSVAEFSKALDQAGMDSVNKAFLISELLNNESVAAGTKQELTSIWNDILYSIGGSELKDGWNTWKKSANSRKTIEQYDRIHGTHIANEIGL